MTRNLSRIGGSVLAAALLATCLAIPAAADHKEIAQGTRFMVELRDKLEAKKAKPGEKFTAITLQALETSDGTMIPSGSKLKGKVSYVEGNKMVLRFERIETRYGKFPIVASIVSVVGERDVKDNVGPEGEIKAEGGRGKGAAIGAIVGGGIGAAIGASQGGGKGAAIGAGVGGGSGALIGAAAGGKDLVLQKGARLEVELEHPLTLA